MSGWQRELKERLETGGVSEERIEWDSPEQQAVVDGRYVVRNVDDGSPGLLVLEMLGDDEVVDLGVVGGLPK